MKRISINKKSIITIGNFDGVHIGHRRILFKAVSFAREKNLISLAITFFPHPKEFFGGKIKLIQPLQQRINLIKKIGIDDVIVLEFNKKLSSFTPEEFVEFLIKNFSPSCIIVGEEFKFGKKQSGNVSKLKTFGKKFGFNVKAVKKVTLYGEKVSSSIIKKYIKENNLQRARFMLGGFYSILGKVTKGKGIGKKFFYPTANIKADKNLLLDNGVYLSRTKVNNNYFNSITYIGNSPTLKRKDSFVETYIFGETEDLYGKEIEIFFVEFLRKEKKFPNKYKLKKQIEKDIAFTKSFFEL